MVSWKTHLVMTRTIKIPGERRSRARLSVAEAKAGLSAALRAAEDGPTVIHNRGRDAAVLVGIEAYARLVGAAGAGETPMAAFLHDLASLKERLDGGADFEPERVVLTPRDPFARARR